MEQTAPVKIKNKQPAALQITAEQILREAKDRQEKPKERPKQTIADKEELDHYQQTKRKEFETIIRRNRMAIGAWLKYAQWEERQNEFERARSVYERALENDSRNQTLWLKYSEMEMKHKNVNRARNVLDRVVMILPRVDLFWYKYTYMEEMLDNVAGAREVFERWMRWEPSEEAWMAYVKFEQRHSQFERARQIFQRFVNCFPQPKNWLKWARFEEQEGHLDRAREIYQQLLTTLDKDFIDQNVYISFAKFESRNKEIERARVIYKYALDSLPDGQKQNLYNSYSQFEKQYGGKEGLEDVVISKRRVKYEDVHLLMQELRENPYSYDLWFDYLRMEESRGKLEKIRELYERSIAQVPLVEEKKYWRRYIFLWIYYAVWEELEAENIERAGQIYANCIKLIPHKSFTFAKIWNMYARYLIRTKNVVQARKVFGSAIGMCAKEKIFKDYIALETDLREFDRVRKLYEKYLEWNPTNCTAWIKYAELERNLGDLDRCRGIFELSVEQPELDMPEVLWKAYIDFETEEQEWVRARDLYTRLLERTRHVKVYIAFALFEYNALDSGNEEQRVAKASSRFEDTYKMEKTSFSGEDRLRLLEAWLEFETEQSTEKVSEIARLMPKTVKKRRRLEDDSGWEEYFDYVFPDDHTDEHNLNLLKVAHEWKAKMADLESDSDSDDED